MPYSSPINVEIVDESTRNRLKMGVVIDTRLNETTVRAELSNYLVICKDAPPEGAAFWLVRTTSTNAEANMEMSIQDVPVCKHGVVRIPVMAATRAIKVDEELVVMEYLEHRKAQKRELEPEGGAKTGTKKVKQDDKKADKKDDKKDGKKDKKGDKKDKKDDKKGRPPKKP